MQKHYAKFMQKHYAKFMQKHYAKFMQEDYAKFMQEDHAKFMQHDYAKVTGSAETLPAVDGRQGQAGLIVSCSSIGYATIARSNSKQSTRLNRSARAQVARPLGRKGWKEWGSRK